MNTNGLAKLYEHLTPFERLPLILAAAARSDEAELDRLSRAAPRIHFGLPDYHGLGEGLELLVLFHTIKMLEMVAWYWRAEAMFSEAELLFDDEKEDKARKERWFGAVRLAAYLIVANADAWNRLAEELKIDPVFLLCDIPGFETVQQAERTARHLAFTVEEATAYTQKAKGKSIAIVTAESIAAGMRDFLDKRIEYWN